MVLNQYSLYYEQTTGPLKKHWDLGANGRRQLIAAGF